MQHAGKECAICKEVIILQIDANGCPACNISFHNNCVEQINCCPQCKKNIKEFKEGNNNGLTRKKEEREVKRSRLAITSFLLGIISCCSCCLGPLFGIPAIIFGIVALGKVKNKSGAGKGFAIAGIIAGIIGSVVLFFPALSAAREKARRISCASNLKSIGLALRMYSQDYNEYFPNLDGAAGLEMLRSQGYLENYKMFICQSTTLTGMDGYEIVEGSCSYIYRGGLTESDDVGTIIMCDKEKNHKEFKNVLFLDGSVGGYKEKEIKKMLGNQGCKITH